MDNPRLSLGNPDAIFKTSSFQPNNQANITNLLLPMLVHASVLDSRGHVLTWHDALIYELLAGTSLLQPELENWWREERLCF